mmetsp:Transcript_31003/g.66436  ORF Transcript_31003/g.66436 Transcript_31003/m.66436 type:complete len:311 (-) Transcript_31003:355-1287(-)
MRPLPSMSFPQVMLAASTAFSVFSLPAANAFQQQLLSPLSTSPSSVNLLGELHPAPRPLITTAAAAHSLFGRKHPVSFVKRKQSSFPDTRFHFSTVKASVTPIDAEITTSATTATEQNSSQRGGLLQSIDNIGLNLKPLAIRAHERSLEYSSNNNNIFPTNGISSEKDVKKSQIKSILFSLQSCTLWTLYLFYRAYRGFFVILPAVFREVFRKLEESQVVVDAFGDDENENSAKVEGDADFTSKEPMRLRTRITISVLSSVLTLSYVISGGLRVLGKFIRTFTSTTSVESSLEAAADEVVKNEDKLRKMK